MSLLALLLGALGSLVASGLLGLANLRWPPAWAGELSCPWPFVVKASLAGALAGTLLASVGAWWSGVAPLALAAVVSSALLGFLTVQSTITDQALRLVDGRLQYLVLGATGLVSFFALQGSPLGEVTAKLMIMLALFFLALRFLIPSTFMGASDSRAMAIMSTTIFPLAGLRGFTLALCLYLLLALGYGFRKLWQEGPRERGWWRVLGKASLPMVPLLLWPTWLLTIASSFFTLGAF